MTHIASATLFRERWVVSRETIERLKLFEQLLIKWQRHINLVSRATLTDIWVRHFSDSAQVYEAFPQCRTWIDIGSGGGFPALVVGLLIADKADDYQLHLVESDQRKCAFLKTVSREVGVRAEIHNCRIKDLSDDVWLNADGVSARALAPLADLVAYSQKALDNGAKGVFLKGNNVFDELTLDPIFSKYQVSFRPSATDPRSSIVLVER